MPYDQIKSNMVDPSQDAGGLMGFGQNAQTSAQNYFNNPASQMDMGQANAGRAYASGALAQTGALAMGDGLTPAGTQYIHNAQQTGAQSAALGASARGGMYAQSAQIRAGQQAQAMSGQNAQAGAQMLSAQQRQQALASMAGQANGLYGQDATIAAANANYQAQQNSMNQQMGQMFYGAGNAANANGINMVSNTYTGNADRTTNAMTGNANNAIKQQQINNQQAQQAWGMGAGVGAAILTL